MGWDGLTRARSRCCEQEEGKGRERGCAWRWLVGLFGAWMDGWLGEEVAGSLEERRGWVGGRKGWQVGNCVSACFWDARYVLHFGTRG